MNGILLALLAGIAAGALNAVGGGGTFVALPALVAAGLSPVVANASATVALLPGAIAGAWVYRREIGPVGDVPLTAVTGASLLGGTVGAVLLLALPSRSFAVAVPWLLAFATLVLLVGRRASAMITRRSRRAGHGPRGSGLPGGVGRPGDTAPSDTLPSDTLPSDTAPGNTLPGNTLPGGVRRPRDPTPGEIGRPGDATAPGGEGERRTAGGERGRRAVDGAAGRAGPPRRASGFLTAQALVAVYGGYFGGAVGILMLAMWGVARGVGPAAGNPTRVTQTAAVYATAAALFLLAGDVLAEPWPMLAMLGGGIAGGIAGAQVGRRLPAPALRATVLVTAVAMTVLYWV
ncbi:sulfite exporter TauE/SafE family protein [Pseudonocardia ailaonensis]|uniref:sulfite exporter TauE/SafE family protein n=1 Tax=Pseudonocardia ailaonensis TaxID=367279 RepID=UPI0031DFFDF2